MQNQLLVIYICVEESHFALHALLFCKGLLVPLSTTVRTVLQYDPYRTYYVSHSTVQDWRMQESRCPSTIFVRSS